MKKTVLIVDKDKDILNLYKNMINWDEYGYEILATVDNEKNAISSYGEYLYDLVITDIDLREGNGLSFLSRIKKMYPSSRFVVISEKSDYESCHSTVRARVHCMRASFGESEKAHCSLGRRFHLR